MFLQCITLGIAILALFISLYTFYLSHIRRGQDWVDTYLHDIWKIIIDHPEFDDQKVAREYPNIEDANIKHRYDSFCSILWNYFESIYDRKLHRQKSLQGIFEYWVPMHKNWYYKNNKFYGDDFKRFIELKFLQKNDLKKD